MERRTALLAATVVAALLYLSPFTFRGWIAHDEGLLGQSAARVLNGQMPHADFDDPYSGGLSYLGAGAFRMLGERSTSLRVVFFLFAAAFVVTLAGLARSLLRNSTAIVALVVAVVWSLPNYFAGLPSWYNLFFATFGTAAIVAWRRNGRRRWLVLAGVFAGCSIAIKVVGLYFAAAAVLILSTPSSGTRPGRASKVFRSLLATAVLLAVIVLVRSQFSTATLAAYILPVAMAVAAVLVRIWSGEPDVPGETPDRRDVANLAADLSAFAAGAAITLLLFLIPFIARGAVHDLYRGVFELPRQRLGFAAFPAAPLGTLFVALPLLLLFLPARWNRMAAAAGLVGATAVYFGSSRALYQLFPISGRWLLPITAVLALEAVWRRRARSDAAGDALLVLLPVAALINLVQFPFAKTIYLCYALPPIILLAAALIDRLEGARNMALAVALTYGLFAVVWFNRTDFKTLGGIFLPRRNITKVLPERCGLYVPPEQADGYTRIVRLIQKHAGPSPFIYATPDCPEIYFLSGKENPTRTFYDFFDPRPGRDERILSMLEERRIPVVVIKRFPEFSGPVDSTLDRALTARYPLMDRVGVFEVRWHEPSSSPGSR